jgi:Putative transposase/Transposase zinc-binding domain
MGLEVADVFRDHGAAWREANRGHLSLGQLKVMSAIERCRTAALGGHVMRCENDACGDTAIAYKSCRNRHCPKCQGAAAREGMEARAAELLPVPYFHVVFTLPSPIGDIAYQNKAVIYNLLFRASAETMLTIAADPKHLGASIGITAVLHSWGSAMTHHPHVHMIVPGGGISLDGSQWITKRPRFLLPVRVLSKRFRRLMIEKLLAAHAARQLTFHGAHAALVNTQAFAAYLAPLKRTRWSVYAKRPLAGPKAVLAYLSRYTHRVAISNRRLIAADAKTVTFNIKDYRINGPARYKTMKLDAHQFIRRFLIHVLPTGFHRIRHYGLLASGVKANNLVPTSCSPASCSTSLRRRPSPKTSLPSRPRPLSPARAAARPCASSRCSRQASLRNTGRPRCPTPSGSTPHEFGQRHSPLLFRSVSLVQDRPRQRSSEPAPRKARIGLGPLLPSQPSPVATTVWLRDHSARHVISGRILSSRVEIPIAPAATLRPTSRGFLP